MTLTFNGDKKAGLAKLFPVVAGIGVIEVIALGLLLSNFLSQYAAPQRNLASMHGLTIAKSSCRIISAVCP